MFKKLFLQTFFFFKKKNDIKYLQFFFLKKKKKVYKQKLKTIKTYFDNKFLFKNIVIYMNKAIVLFF
jgi:hypothetical protein